MIRTRYSRLTHRRHCCLRGLIWLSPRVEYALLTASVMRDPPEVCRDAPAVAYTYARCHTLLV
eukprot:scaffold10238_cov105-Isochrysis_galbana.AAC.2